jgi:putative ABC transport system permease protein
MAEQIDQLTAAEPIAEKTSRKAPSLFFVRTIVVAGIIAFIMWYFNVNIGSIGQGLAYSLVGVSVFITFRILHFPDLTVDGAFPIGGAVCAVMIAGGTAAELTLFVAFAVGAIAGLITALITIIFRVEGLLSSIIVITGAYTVTLRVMSARSNVPLIGERTILSPYQPEVRRWMVENMGDNMRRQSNNVVEIIVFLVVVGLVLLVLNWFMHTELGLMMRAAGKNPQVVRSFGVNHHVMVTLALMVANGLAGLAGALAVQQLGFADITLGFGSIIRGLAALLIGEVLLRPKSIGQQILSAALGMVIFDVSRAWVFSALDLPTTDIRLVTALVVLAALAAPNLMDRWQEYRKRSAPVEELHTDAEEGVA